MSHTKRNQPKKLLDKKEQKFADKGKFKHGLKSKKCPAFDDTLEFSQSGKKEAKKEKHRKDRSQAKKQVIEQSKDTENG
jgi:hypothetical protein